MYIVATSITITTQPFDALGKSLEIWWITMKTNPRWNRERECWTVAETPKYWVDILPMIFNHRVVLTPKDCPVVYDAGWCYSDFPSALQAVEDWDIDNQDEPAGAIKRAV